MVSGPCVQVALVFRAKAGVVQSEASHRACRDPVTDKVNAQVREGRHELKGTVIVGVPSPDVLLQPQNTGSCNPVSK